MLGNFSASASVPRRDGARLARALVRWFHEHRRRLPFREDPDPWRILVSEVMLQQTRVEAMLPRYRGFVARFPDAGSFAEASADEAVASWSGLGYYRRARALHRAAGEISRQGFPRTEAGLRALPGIGPYTAAAVASIAFGEPVAAVDGNVRRVLARRFGVEGPTDRASFRRRIRELADQLVRIATQGADPAAAPGDWNQALMELGALVCTPAAPRCAGCPLRGRCVAFLEGRVAELPERPERRAPVAVRLATGLVRDRRGRVLLFRRRRSPMRGLYELPGGPCRVGETPRKALTREARARYGLVLSPGSALPSFRHTVMDQRLTVYPFFAAVAGERGPPVRGRWTAPDELDRIPAGAILKKALAIAGSESPPVDCRALMSGNTP